MSLTALFGFFDAKKPQSTNALRIMKLTAVLFLAACLQAAARPGGPTVTLSGKNIPVKKVFREIQKQTGLTVFVDEAVLAKAGSVTLNVQNMPVAQAIKFCLMQDDYSFRLSEGSIVIRQKPVFEDYATDPGEAPPPPINVHGRVLNDKGEPVEGITVTIKGTKKATFTDANGEFTLKGVNGGATLVFTGVNVETYELTVNNKTELAVSLKTKTAAMNDLTVTANTGYQTISRERATGSFEVVGRQVLDKRPVSDVSTALQGLVPGLQAKENLDGTMEFLIRGTSSIYAGKGPLVVVDGFPVTGTVIDPVTGARTGSDFSNINPNDVESITVLKDAAAASIWGARSANGVIVITTKRPKAGRDKMTVEVNAFARIYNNIDLDQVMSQATSSDQIRYEKLAFDRQLFFTTPYSPSFANINAPLTLAQEFMFANKYNGYAAAKLNASLDSLAQVNNRGQLKDRFLRNGIVDQFSINLSGATERTKTYGSLLYERKKDGIIKKGYERYLMNFNNQFQATKYMQLVFGANVQYKKIETSGPDIAEMQNLSPYETLVNPDGSYSANLNTWNREQLRLLPLDKFPYSDWSYNLLREVRGRQVTNEQFSARIQAGLNIKLLKGIDFDAKVQYERIKTDFSNYQSEETFFVRNIVNTNVVYNNTTRVVGTQYVPKGGISRTNSNNLESYVVRNQLNVNRVLASQFNVNAIAGMEVSSYLTTTKTDPWVYGYFPDKNQSTVPPFGYGSAGNTFTNFRGTTGQTLQGGNPAFGWGKDKYASFYGNAAITYRSRYTLSGSARSDASNYITDNPRLRWSPLWSVGGMWRMIDESFMKHVSFLDNLALRFTYGKNGNAEKTTSTKPLLSVSTSPSTTTGTITATILDNGNPFLRWEKTTTANLGIDYSLFKRRLFGKIDFYNKLGQDITGNIVLPATTGTTTQKFNNAEIINRGIELEAGSDFNLAKVRWNTTLTYAYNWNRVNKLFYPSYLAFQLVDPTTPVEGRPVGPVYAYTFLGMKDSIPYVAGPKGAAYAMNAVQLHNTGLGLDFLNYEGTTVPPHTLGWVNNFNAYGFNLMIVIVGKFGGVYRNPVFNFPTYVGSAKTNVSMFVNDVFNHDPNIPDFPKYLEPQFYLWDRYVPNLHGLIESSSFVECKEIDFEYNLPSRLIKALQLNSLRIFTQVRDLGMLWHANKKGYNPEWLPGTQRPVTSYTFGINAKF